MRFLPALLYFLAPFTLAVILFFAFNSEVSYNFWLGLLCFGSLFFFQKLILPIWDNKRQWSSEANPVLGYEERQRQSKSQLSLIPLIHFGIAILLIVMSFV